MIKCGRKPVSLYTWEMPLKWFFLCDQTNLVGQKNLNQMNTISFIDQNVYDELFIVVFYFFYFSDVDMFVVVY